MQMEISRHGMSRIDPGRFSEPERAIVQQLQHLLQQEGRPALIARSGEKIVLPQPVYELLVYVLSQISKGDAIQLVPSHREVTTQAAANFLGVSRPHVVKLIEDGKIPFRMVGAHRRVDFKDLLEYAAKRGRARSSALTKLTKEAEKAGVYDRVIAQDAV